MAEVVDEQIQDFFSIDGTECHDRIVTKSSENFHKDKKKKKAPDIIPSRDEENIEGIHPLVETFNMDMVSIDMDALFTCLKIHDLSKAFFDTITIMPMTGRIGNKTENVVVNHKLIKIREVAHIKIGTIKLNAGIANIFYVCPGLEGVNKHITLLGHFKEFIPAIPSITKYQNGDVDGLKVLSCKLAAFSTQLQAVSDAKVGHSNACLFIETFGNKENMTINSENYLEEAMTVIRKSVVPEHAPYLKVDFCVSLTKPGYCTFISREFFKKFKTQSNYHLFLNLNLANCHRSTWSLKNSRMIRDFEHLEKLNCYNRTEDFFGCIKGCGPVPSICMGLMKSKCIGHSPIAIGKGYTKEWARVNQMVQAFKDTNVDTFDCRLETRFAVSKLSAASAFIFERLEGMHVHFYDTKSLLNRAYDFSFYLLSNLQIKESGPINSLFKAIYSEYLLKEVFCKGSTNVHLMPIQYQPLIRTFFSRSLVLTSPEVDLDVVPTGIQPDYIKNTILRIITFAEGASTRDGVILRNLIEIKDLSVVEAAEVVVRQYYKDICKRFNLGSDDSFSLLRSVSHPYDRIYTKVVMDLTIVKFFSLTTHRRWRRFPFRCMNMIYLKESGILVEDWYVAIKQVFLSHRIDMAFNIAANLKKQKERFVHLYNVSGDVVRRDVFDDEAVKIRRGEVFARYKASIILRFNATIKVNWSDSERIRLIAVRDYYQKVNGNLKGVWTFAKESTLFGFTLVRSVERMKDAYVRTMNLPNAKKDPLINSANVWSPENYSLEMIYADMREFGIDLTEAEKTDFSDLHVIDMRNYKLALSLEIDENLEIPAILPANRIEPDRRVVETIGQIESAVASAVANVFQLFKAELEEFITAKLEGLMMIQTNGTQGQARNNSVSSEDFGNYDNIKFNQQENTDQISEVNMEKVETPQDQPSNTDLEEILFLKFRYRLFSKDQILELETLKLKSSENISELLESLAVRNRISILQGAQDRYMFNLKLKNGDVIEYLVIKKRITEAVSKKTELLPTKSELRNLFSGLRRPEVKEWNEYIDDLLDSKLLRTEFMKGKPIYYFN